ncbi:energy transducer TonB [Corallococcus exiguus]|uniref:energy transducer TonB family protein n=1 Tax=Corallococcus TaxID=83461 RepID=UPI000EA00FEE|nr:energy transducer TonB [Corallococcus sp. AB032C]NNB90493.1 energy transducer TonB [Corallococcus exiguus]RKI40019.1 energy transducer TonB [Corallococcus sp. AB004]NNB95102.1 energy transducer TonB [Corallococcus exiguus]NNC03831.1 energy transducer TonB [Corallococcus exiguus]NPC50529.1 energy transducer TonB [Corallococcus exiguus]
MGTGSSTDWRQRRARKQRGPLRYLVAGILALLAQVAFVGFVLLVSAVQANFPHEKRPARPTSVAVRPLTSDQWAKNRGAVTPQQTKPRPTEKREPKEEKKPDETKPQGQVVDVAPGNDQQSPDAKYLAEHNNTTEKETRARDQTAFYRNAMPQKTAPQKQEGAAQDQVQPPRVSGNNGTGADDRAQSQGGKKPVFEMPETRRKQEIAMKTDPRERGPGMAVKNQSESDATQGNAKRLRIQPGQGEESEQEGSTGRVGSPGLATLMPSQAAMDKVVGAAPNDMLRDQEEGDGTFLNTREWKYASFFNRVKQSVGMHWNPNEQLRMRDPTGNIYSGRDRQTLLTITLDERGAVKDIQVEKSSGLDFLDMEAVASFKRAQPFPNPPSGLLSQDATVRFQFGFFLEMGGGPRMRLFRQ